MSNRTEPDLTILSNLKTKKLTTGSLNLGLSGFQVMNFSGAFSASNVLIRWTIIGNLCILNIPSVFGTSSAATVVTSTTPLPLAASPPVSTSFFAPGMVGNAVEGIGYVTVRNTGIIQLSFNTTNGAFPATGLGGFDRPQNFVYYLN
jgi:hypothetical protein